MTCSRSLAFSKSYRKVKQNLQNFQGKRILFYRENNKKRSKNGIIWTDFSIFNGKIRWLVQGESREQPQKSLCIWMTDKKTGFTYNYIRDCWNKAVFLTGTLSRPVVNRISGSFENPSDIFVYSITAPKRFHEYELNLQGNRILFYGENTKNDLRTRLFEQIFRYLNGKGD